MNDVTVEERKEEERKQIVTKNKKIKKSQKGQFHTILSVLIATVIIFNLYYQLILKS